MAAVRRAHLDCARMLLGRGANWRAIDNDGNATKPFLLPQRNPKKYYTQTVYSFNTPDFTSRSVKANGRKMGRNIESDQRTNTTVNDKNLFKSNHQEEK